jgi:hypothetical protein
LAVGRAGGRAAGSQWIRSGFAALDETVSAMVRCSQPRTPSRRRRHEDWKLMLRKAVLRIVVLAGVAATTLAGVGTPAATADSSSACTYFVDCNAVNGHISRATVHNRAMKWVTAGYGYSQNTADAVNGTGANPAQKWRRDCSGYVSMAWRLSGVAPNYGLNTSTLQNVSFEISYTALQQGDILDDPTGGSGYDAHVIIFDGWVSSVGGDFYMFEENPAYGGAVRHKASVVTYLQVLGIKGRADNGNGFIPRRYNKITNS